MNATMSDAADAAARRVRRVGLALCLLVVTHGSLFPWLFAAPASWPLALRQMLVERLWWTGLGDAIANVLLFMPVGAFGMLLGDGSARTPVARGVRVMLGSGVFALALQVAQLWLPERTAALSDVLWNVVGTAAGLLLAPALRPGVERVARSRLLAHHVALTMGALWLAAQCWPLMPAHNLRHAFTALRPLMRRPELNLVVVCTTALSLAVALALARGVRRRWLFGLLLVAAALCGQLLMRHLELTPSLLIGWVAGLVLGQALLRLQAQTWARVVMVLALTGIVFASFTPWQWSAEPGDFHWIPLLAPLQAARVVHTLELIWAAFWCGALMLGARALGWHGTASAVVLTVLVLVVEVAQRWQPGQLADITPVVLPAIWWWVWRRWPPRDL
jgi:glycopeptide antibiotics resistance protein